MFVLEVFDKFRDIEGTDAGVFESCFELVSIKSRGALEPEKFFKVR